MTDYVAKIPLTEAEIDALLAALRSIPFPWTRNEGAQQSVLEILVKAKAEFDKLKEPRDGC